jgi:hypothetical protein
VAVLPTHPLAEVDATVSGAIEGLGHWLAGRARGGLERPPRLRCGALWRTYVLLLRATTSLYMDDAAFADALAKAGDAGNDDDYATLQFSGATLSHRDWLLLQHARARFADAWEPILRRLRRAAVPGGLDHGVPARRGRRTVAADDRRERHGMAADVAVVLGRPFGAMGLPSTVAPIGPASDGLPVGVQIVARRFGDLTSLRFAQQLKSRPRVPPAARLTRKFKTVKGEKDHAGLVQRVVARRAQGVLRRLPGSCGRRVRLHDLFVPDFHAAGAVGHEQVDGGRHRHVDAGVIAGRRDRRGTAGGPLRPRARASLDDSGVRGVVLPVRYLHLARTADDVPHAAGAGFRRRVVAVHGAGDRADPNPAHRGKYSGFTASSYSFGWGGAAIAYAITFNLFEPEVAWRVCFFLGILPALVVVYLRRNLQEPEVFLKSRAERGNVSRRPISRACSGARCCARRCCAACFRAGCWARTTPSPHGCRRS